MSLHKDGQKTPEGFNEAKKKLLTTYLKIQEQTTAARVVLARSKWVQDCKGMPTAQVDENVAPNGTQPSV